MADDSSSVTSAKVEIDLDNIEVEVLILCKNPNAVNACTTFLNRRGWPTTVVTDVGKCVEYVADRRPDFVLLSLSHPSSAITKLPDLITQTFNLPCIGFVESSDATSSARLSAAKMRYKISGLLSGPSIYRTIRKILADRFDIEHDDKAFPEGPTTAADGGVIIQKTVSGPTANKGAQLIKGGDQPVKANEEESGPTSLFFKKSGKPVMADPLQDPNLLDPQSEADAILAGVAPVKKKSRQSLKDLEGAARLRDSSGNMLFGQSLEKDKQPHVTMMPTPDLIASVKKSLFGESGEDITAYLGPETAGIEEGIAADRSQQSLMEKAVEGAMGQFCQTIPDVAPLKLLEVTHAGVFPVDSPTHPGYLVVVWQAPDQVAREEFLRGCQHEIELAFASMNVPGKLEGGFWVELPPVGFEEWTSREAKFRFTFAHQKREVGIAFFQMNEPLPKPTPPAAEHGMYSIKVDKISTDVPVTFRAFIHFVQNNRFFLYLRNGRRLQPEQKQRLLEKHKDFYMKSGDLENLRQYMATTYLGDSVKKLKKAA